MCLYIKLLHGFQKFQLFINLTAIVWPSGCEDVCLLESNHKEAVTRIILHVLYSVEILQAVYVAVYVNGADIIVLCIYNSTKYLILRICGLEMNCIAFYMFYRQ